MDFYLIARGFTAFWGTLMIPLSYAVLSRIRKNAGIIASVFTAFLPVFVTHSAYATPDIPLTFAVMLIIFLSERFLNTDNFKYLIGICITTAAGITIKYTAAVCCLWIAILLFVKKFMTGQYRSFLKYLFFSAFIVISVCFLLAPNLFTNFQQTLETVMLESRNTHLGADGLGFFGNFLYYLKSFLHSSGYECLILLTAGVFFCLLPENYYSCIFLHLGGLFWVFTSILSLHWERWGMPIYGYFIFLSALGTSFIFESLHNSLFSECRIRNAGKALSAVFCLLPFMILCSCFFTSLVNSVASYKTETRILALSYCQEHEITEQNAIYDGYTPFMLNSPSTISFSIGSQGDLILPEGKEQAEYAIVCSKMYDRYFAEPEKYSGAIYLYNYLEQNYPLIYKANAVLGGTSYWAYRNFCGKIRILMSPSDITGGPEIKIYRLTDD